MSQIETQLVITLQQVARAIAAVGQSAQRSPLEVWGPPIAAALISMGIAAAGWLAIDRSNQKNNRDLLELQTKELARNRILDALDEYLEYLRDTELPLMVMLREEAVKHRGPIAIFDGFSTQSKSVLDCAAARDTITSLTLFDARETRWIGALHRNSWIYDGDSHVSQQATQLEFAHKAIMADQVEYYKELLSKTDEGEDASLAFLEKGRSAEATERIDGQRERIHTVYTALNSPVFLRGGGTTERKPAS